MSKKSKKEPLGFCSNKERREQLSRRKEKHDKKRKKQKHPVQIDLVLIGLPLDMEFVYEGTQA